MKKLMKIALIFVVMVSFIVSISSVNAMSKSDFISYLNNKFPGEASRIQTLEGIIESKNISSATLDSVVSNINTISSTIGEVRDIEEIKKMNGVVSLAKNTANLLGLTVEVKDNNTIVIKDGAKVVETLNANDLKTLVVKQDVKGVQNNNIINKTEAPKTGVSYLNIIISLGVIAIAVLGIIFLSKKK